jgi:hypothetical protein
MEIKLNNMLLNNQWVNEEIKRKNFKNPDANNNGSAKYPNI